MSDNAPLLFNADPEKFRVAVFTDDQQTRFDLLKENIEDWILCEIIRYGIYNQTEMIASLKHMYRDLVLKMFDEKQRRGLFQHVTGMVQNLDVISVNALLPFIAEETHHPIVATAVIDYVSVGPLTNNDPMSRPKDIIGMIQSGMLQNPGAAFGGLIHLGDARLCKLLWPLREELDNSAVNEAVKCSTGLIYGSTVEFYIDWLEGMEGDDQDGLFGIIASALALIHRSSKFDTVATGIRPFPILKNISPAQQAKSRELAKLVPLADYTKIIAPRLYALERTEPPPRVMPQVLLTWGLEPLSQASEVAQLDDRIASPVKRTVADFTAIPDGKIVQVKSEWFDGDGEIFLTWGLLNPNGPTLYCLGEKRVNGKRRLFFRWLHMLGGATYYATHSDPENLTYQYIFECFTEFNQYLRQAKEPTIFDNIPSFMIVNRGDETMFDITRRVFKGSDCARKNWAKELAYQRQFGDDFFGRAGCELREAYEVQIAQPNLNKAQKEFLDIYLARYRHIPAFADAVIPKYGDFQLSDNIFDEWWRNINTSEFRRSCIGQLSSMWNGAISLMSEDPTFEKVPFEKIADFLAKFDFQIG